MIEENAPVAAKPGVTPAKAILTIIVLVPVIGILLGLGHLAGVSDFLFAGFLFVLYWTGLKGMAPNEFWPALVGSLGGLGLAYLIHALPHMLGLAGAVLVGVGVLGAIYLMVREQASFLINYAFMLLLTVGGTPAFQEDAHFLAGGAAILICGAYAGGLTLILRALAARGNKTMASASAG